MAHRKRSKEKLSSGNRSGFVLKRFSFKSCHLPSKKSLQCHRASESDMTWQLWMLGRILCAQTADYTMQPQVACLPLLQDCSELLVAAGEHKLCLWDHLYPWTVDSSCVPSISSSSSSVHSNGTFETGGNACKYCDHSELGCERP